MRDVLSLTAAAGLSLSLYSFKPIPNNDALGNRFSKVVNDAIAKPPKGFAPEEEVVVRTLPIRCHLSTSNTQVLLLLLFFPVSPPIS